MKVGGSGETLHINYLQAQHRFDIIIIQSIIIHIIIILLILLITITITRGEYSCTASTSLDSVTSSTELRVLSEPPKITSLPSQLGEVKSHGENMI